MNLLRVLQGPSLGSARVAIRPVKLRLQSHRHYKIRCWLLIALPAWCAYLEAHR